MGNHEVMLSRDRGWPALLLVLIGAALIGGPCWWQPFTRSEPALVFTWSDGDPDAFFRYQRYFALRVLPRAESLALAVRQLGIEVEQGHVSKAELTKRSRQLTGELFDLHETTTSWSAPTVFHKPAMRLDASTSSFYLALQVLKDGRPQSFRTEWHRGWEQLQYARRHIRLDGIYSP